MLLNADVESFHPPAFDDFFLLPRPSVQVDGGPEWIEPAVGGSWVGDSIQDVGPPSSAGIDAGDRPPPTSIARVVHSLVRATGLLVADGAGNVMSSAEPFEAIKYSPQVPAGGEPDFATVVSGPMPPDYTPSYEDLAEFPKTPWSPNYTYAGSMDGLNEMAVRIPVGPMTRMLTLGLKPEHGDGAYTPRIDQVFLMGRGGELLASISGVSFMNDGSGQTLYISIHGAPFGGEVVVRLVPASNSSTTPGGDQDGTLDGDGSIPDWDGTSFQLDIQRTDSNLQSTSSPSTTTGAVGPTYVITTVDRAVDGRPSAPGSAAPGATTSTPESGPGPRVAYSPRQARDDADLGLADEVPPAVFLGPLVSRTAAPLGPALATSTEESTPSTGRGGRSRSDGLDAFGVDLDLDMILAIKARSEQHDPADVSARPDPELTTLRGPGGIPIMVAGLRAEEDRQDAAALAASVLQQAEQGPLLADGCGAASDAEPDVARAGLATRALGFFIGMGLASGPLYPDLVALARRKLRRRPRPGRRRPR